MLSDRGHTAEHVADLGMLSAGDLELWRRAEALGAVLITKDEDFAQLHRDQRGPVVLWIRIGNTTRRALLEWFEPRLPEIEDLIANGEKLIELR
jgi:predicted nuclease of predicted toxin-antitoxin system